MDRQRVLLIFGAAFVAALLLSLFVYTKTQGPKTEKTVKVVVAIHDMPAGTRLRKGDIKLVSIPESDLPRNAALDLATAIDRVLLFPINANETVTGNKITSASGVEGLASTIDVGKRGISVPITDLSGASGLIQPRSHVDVLFTRVGSMNEAVTTVVVQDVVVLSIGRVTEVQQVANPASNAPRPQQQAATLLVTPEEAAKIEFAKNQGKISLALRNPLDKSVTAEFIPVMADSLHPMFMSGRKRGAVPNLRDRNAWNRLIGDEAPPPPKKEEKKEPPKPRYVVDVYRGDKHVQEIFQ